MAGLALPRMGLGLRGRRGAAPLVVPANFISAAVSAGLFTAPPSWLSISCATTGRTVQTGASTLVTGIGANAWRARNAGVATGLSVENAATNALVAAGGTPINCRGPNAGGMTITNGQADPAGGTNAALFSQSAMSFGDYWNTAAPTAANVSAWVLWASGTGNAGLVAKWRSGGNYAPVTTSLTTWTPIDDYDAAIGGACDFDCRVNTPGTSPGINPATSWYGYAAQMEAANKYRSSYIGGARAADVLSTTAAIAPSGRLNMVATVAPNFATAEQANDSPILWWDANNNVTLQQSTSKVIVKVGGSVVLSSAALTWSREQGIGVAVHLTPGGSLSLGVNGATAGNGTSTATGVAAFTTSGTAYLLGTSSGAQECADLRTLGFYQP